jgi:pre-mRNA-processing factor 40
VDVFKSLLRDYNVTPNATWDATMRTIIKDDRYKTLATLPERKAAFRDYIEETKTREREERRAKEEALRADFFAMLRDGDMDARSTYRKAMTLFDRDPRWKAVDREKDREDLFDDYLWELETKQREEERNNRESNLKAYHQLLDEYVLNVTSQWRKFREDVKDDPRFMVLDKLDRLALFEHRIRDLERIEAEEKRKSREVQRRQYRKNRDAFRALLQEAYAAGKLDRTTKWKRFKRTLKDDPRYDEMIGQPGSTPSELYGDFVEDLQERHEETKKILDRIMKEGNITITGWMSEEQFLAAISTHPSYPNLDQKAATKLFLEMREVVERKERRERRKREKNFALLLKSHKVNASSTYDDSVRERLAEEASFKAVPDEEERKTLFERYVDNLKNRPADYETSSEEEGMIESESDGDSKDRKRSRHNKDRKDRKRRRHSSKEKEKEKDDDKHKKRRKHSDKDKDRKHKRRGDDKHKREGSVSEGDHRKGDGEREDGEMDE